MIFPSTAKVVFFVILSAIAICVSSITLIKLNVLPSILGVIYGLFYLFYLLSLLIKHNPVVTLTKDGILDNTQLFNFGLIRWNEIEKIHSGPPYTLIIIDTKNPEAIIARQTNLKRVVLRINQILFTFIGPINIQGMVLPCSREQLIDIIQNYSSKESTDR